MNTKIAPIVLKTVIGEHGVYEIRQSMKDGKFYCTCPAWRFGHGKDCKHLTTYMAKTTQQPVEALA